MRLWLAVLTGVVLGFAASFAPIAQAVPRSDVQLNVLLNGKPTLIGMLVSDGGGAVGYTSNTTTAQPFTVTGGTVLLVECSAAARVGLIGTCSDVPLLSDGGRNSNFCEALAIQPAQRKFVVPDNVSSISAVVADTKTCAVWQMQ